jgi:hypothetical protein
MLTTALEGFGGVAAMLAPVLVELQDRVDIRDATIAALWDYVLELRYWMVKGQVGEPPTMPSTLTVAAVRARISA